MSTTSPSSPADTHNLSRFLHAQDHNSTYRRALSEIRAGRKRSHWMWFVFPQLAGLSPSPSPTARFFAIRSLAEAEAYLSHPVLGARLREISTAVLREGRQAGSVGGLMGGEVDVDKLRSCMTLFKRVVDGKEGKGVEEGDRIFEEVLGRWFGGEEDRRTGEVLAERGEGR
ncbi:hypothetical protein NKR19_g3611 [Coniochaeta hoffmannii]|uniref:DUF1810-domain-containing protein n=1 Tax=Coniochaeta hoffmannii TaxID=91930 RepID=A0AA38VLX7_9PEZI|nr:hypothetical protein NKR19_g3611 [Coniochaeta hoffmannii]